MSLKMNEVSQVVSDIIGVKNVTNLSLQTVIQPASYFEIKIYCLTSSENKLNVEVNSVLRTIASRCEIVSV